MYFNDKKKEMIYCYVIHTVFTFNKKYILISLSIFASLNVFKIHFYVKYHYVHADRMYIILTGDDYL